MSSTAFPSSRKTCCCSVRTACKILACLSIVGCIRNLWDVGSSFSILNEIPYEISKTSPVKLLVTLMWILLAIILVHLTLSIVLLVGAFKESQTCMKIWMIGTVIDIIAAIAVNIVVVTGTSLGVADYAQEIAMYVIGLIVYIYTFSVVFRYWKDIRDFQKSGDGQP